jgi:glucosamine--fructose-6-phosphate aminotransferase (isomerizing)
MCSVVGYVGKRLCKNLVLKGLEKLEYRGYDSAGFACVHHQKGTIESEKAEGELRHLVTTSKNSDFNGYIGIGHTRWATHGKADVLNAHPHYDQSKRIAVVHNGIIENHTSLKTSLSASGHTFVSETDTEVIAHLFADIRKYHAHVDISFKESVVSLVNQLDGAYAFLIMTPDCSDTMIAVRKKSPLCIGVGDQEMFVASDVLAFSDDTDKVIYMPDESFAFITPRSINMYSFSGRALSYTAEQIDKDTAYVSSHNFEHFMLKEIYEQKNVLKRTVSFYRDHEDTLLHEMGIDEDVVGDISSINIIGCGTSYHAGQIASYFFESIASIPCNVWLASEFRYNPFFQDTSSLSLAITQSGETADTLEGIRFLSEHNMHTIAVTNIAQSSSVRESNGLLLTHAGKEVSVASTKAFSAQLSSLYILSHYIAWHKKRISYEEYAQSFTDILSVSDILETSIERYKEYITDHVAPLYAQCKHAIFLGRHISYPFAQEASLKLKEISYIFTDCYPAGELKHGSIALVDESVPVFIFSHTDPHIYKKLLSNAQEVKARSGRLIVCAFEGQHELIELADTVFTFPRVKPCLAPLAMVGVMQFLTYSIAKELNRPIDKPRNLAKSVTVE